MDAEKAHELILHLLHAHPHILSLPFRQEFPNDKYALTIGEVRWPFPVGLAAGLDKNAECVDFFSSIGFGAIEVGTVTPKAQPGNKRPRLFRYPEEKSLRNCMGFNNGGSERVFENIKKIAFRDIPLGVNLGKNKWTNESNAPGDYQFLYDKFSKIADYLVINISSPNTPGLRDLQNAEKLKDLFRALEEGRKKTPCPLFLKLSPDMSFEDIPEVVKVVAEFKLNGIIATNTTIMKERGDGGVSGDLLKEKARQVRERILIEMKKYPDLSFVGVGGISDYEDLVTLWRAGGSAAQIYSSFIYQGPEILKKFKQGIDEDLKKYKMKTVEELILYYRAGE